MEAVISNFRMSRHAKYEKHMILQPAGSKSKKDAESLVKKTVVWKSPSGKEIKGTIASVHGGNGAVRVIFEKGMPGQAIGTKVSIQ